MIAEKRKLFFFFSFQYVLRQRIDGLQRQNQDCLLGPKLSQRLTPTVVAEALH
jgi:BarA-like signal transduction histidine kinase